MENSPEQNGAMNPQNIAGSAAPSDSKFGPVIGIVIVVIVLILGALYFWGEKLNKEPEEVVNSEETYNNLNSQDSSDEMSSIEADLETTDFDSLDANLQNDLR